MRVLVCGGRDYERVSRVERELDDLLCRAPYGCMLVIQGGAQGADRLAREWCCKRSVEYVSFAADWKAHGKAAGPMRNQRMIDEGRPDLVLAFPGGRGTADMVRRAEAAGIKICEISG